MMKDGIIVGRQHKIQLVILILIGCIMNGYSSIKIRENKMEYMPDFHSFEIGFQKALPFNRRHITPWEYATDPIILYASMWAMMGITVPLWEQTPTFISSGDDFVSRVQMEPFATGRIDEVTKQWNGMTVLKNDFYAKNFIEPIYWTYMAMYLRSKNYHPALYLGELFSLSLMYEFTVRPFFMNASFEQVLKNPAVGSLIGLLLDEVSNFLLSTPYKGLHVLGYILNPFNALPTSRVHPLVMFKPYNQAASIEAIINLD